MDFNLLNESVLSAPSSLTAPTPSPSRAEGSPFCFSLDLASVLFSQGSEHRGTEDTEYRGTVAIQTHGCKLNQADSDVLARRFAEAGYRLVESVSEADVFVLNTCTVTATADAKARQALRSARRANPRALIVAAGCYAQRAAAELAQLEAVSLVVGNVQKDQLVSLVLAARGASPPGPLSIGDGEGVAKPGMRLSRSRAMVKIQEGCNQVCAYCIVPRVRGRERSIPPETLVAQINQRLAEGFQEVVLTGTQLGSYGFDIPGASLLKLLQQILAETALTRLRVSSLQAQEISPQLLELWQDLRLCPHFHVPLQSGSNRILKRMHRRYDTAQFASTVELVRRTVPEAGITTDLILGFPGEGEMEFRESRDFAEAMGFSDMHIFPYSARPGTSAAHFGAPVPGPVKKERTTVMLAVARRHFEAFRRQQLGKTRTVLWEAARERAGATVYGGLTDNYIRVYSDSPPEPDKRISQARLVELVGDWIYVRPVTSHQ